MLDSLNAASKVWLPLSGVWLLYLVGLAVYRLYFSPLARVPGPKLAALTGWYEVYWDIGKSGRFPWHIKALHEKYGPVVRIHPSEVHISDPSFANVLFTNSVKRDKYAAHRGLFGIPQSTFGSIGHDEHKMRRQAMAKIFSKKNILSLEPMIQEKVDILCSRLAEFRDEKKIMNIRLLFTCFTVDIITQFAFARSYNILHDPDLAPRRRRVNEATQKVAHFFKHFPALWLLVRNIPYGVMTSIAPDTHMMLDLQHDNRIQARKVMAEYSPGQKTSYSTIFHELIDSNLPPAEKTFNRLWQEGQSLMGAGTETTSNSLTYIVISLLLHPEKLDRLKEELATLQGDMSLPRLEQLPYLNAVISEGIRLATGVTSRLVRVTHGQPVVYKDFVFPAETAVSMSTIVQHSNPDLFPNPSAFEPERWLDGKVGKETILSFGKGPRACIGMHLAYAELYLVLGNALSRFNFELFETDREDIEPSIDGFSALPKATSKGPRVLVL